MNIKHIRNYLRTKVGSNIVVIYYGCRNRKEIYRGILYKLYRNVFIIKMPNGEIRSFTYIDILTKTVIVQI